MSLEYKDRIKQKKITTKGIVNIFKYSINGIRCYAKDGKSIIIYLFCCACEVLVASLVGISLNEWLLLIFMMLLTLSCELINTAIEAICDLITREYNDFVRIAKDCASASTFVLAFATLVISLIMYIW